MQLYPRCAGIPILHPGIRGGVILQLYRPKLIATVSTTQAPLTDSRTHLQSSDQAINMPHRTKPLTTTINGKEIDVADLETVDLSLLATQEPTEVAKLFKAAQSSGFFYLNLQNDAEGKQLLADLPHIYAVSEKYFDQPQSVKMRDFRDGQNPSQDRGYA